ncbi:MAG: GlsB/YeaQ/YmgE family stress response membrane protein [Planctomycetes bacterium]|nr:GlsB/YeaQ/YmgE family stress response membrane protein [Planctomycetota bacterium]
MTILELGLLLLIAAICGGVGQSLAGYSRGGCLASVALGFIGALLGSWLSQASGMPELFVVTIDSVKFPLIWSIIGATLFVALVALVARPSSPPRGR